MASAQQTELPRVYERLVASGVGNSFREVAVVEQQSLTIPGSGEVCTLIFVK